jgi:Predicted membrane protein (DUF2207)
MFSLNVSAGSAYFLVFPALLLGYYLVCWLLVGRDPAIENVTPQYEPPPGVSPGVARYIVTGGSDGTTLAAVLAQLAARGVVAIQPEAGNYRIKLLRQDVAVLPEEAALVDALLGQKVPVLETGAAEKPEAPDTPDAVTHELREAVQRIPEQHLASQGLAIAAQLAMSPHEAVINPRTGVEIKAAVDAIQDSFRKNFRDIYFRWNYGYVLAGVAATFLFGLGTAVFVESQAPSLFVTLWLAGFTTAAGLVMSGFWTSRPSRPSIGQRVTAVLMPLFFFVLPGFLIAQSAMPQARLFIVSLLLAVALNSMFFVLMRAPTPAGRKALAQLAGFREFLVRVEQDRLERANMPQEKAELLNRFLPYAIALEVKEAWGDTMASDFSNTIVER